MLLSTDQITTIRLFNDIRAQHYMCIICLVIFVSYRQILMTSATVGRKG